jgi:hypothetical protein
MFQGVRAAQRSRLLRAECTAPCLNALLLRHVGLTSWRSACGAAPVSTSSADLGVELVVVPNRKPDETVLPNWLTGKVVMWTPLALLVR